MINLTPLADRVIIRQTQEIESESTGGIFMPDATPDTIGEVLAVGPGKWVDGGYQTIDLEVGDSVLFGMFSGTKVSWQGEELLFMFSNDILARLVKDRECEIIPGAFS